LESSDGTQITGIGRRWISFARNRHDGGADHEMLDWRTGRVMPAPRSGRGVDLDAASGTSRRRPCSSVALRKGAWVLERCGRRPLALVKAGRATHSVTLGDRAVAWVTGTTVHARALRAGGRERRWRAPRSKTGVVGLAEVGGHLLVTIQGGPLGGRNGFSFSVYRGRLP
ncbi:MAG: hypothetical protein QOC82_3509, partial [Frankiaceae bacterium]|nr:hypothetical protein [Frankiaceae bacterium]